MTVPSYDVGTVATLSAGFSGAPALADVRLYVRRPDSATATVYSGADAGVITDLGGGNFQKKIAVDVAGPWYWTFAVEGTFPAEAAIDGEFVADASEARTDGVTDLRDLRVMIPATRRAVDGPTATSELQNATLDDGQLLGVIADAVGDVILLTGSVFGKTLDVTDRDSYYQAPQAWQTSEELTSNEQRVIVAQAAITFFFQTAQNLRVSERIADESTEWEYSLSASFVRDHLAALMDMRDRALEAIQAPGLVEYVNFLAVRDSGVARWVEPFAAAGLGGQVDFRFGLPA